MKGKRFKFSVLLVMTLAVLAWCADATNAGSLSDGAFLELARMGTAQEVEAAIRAGANVNARNRLGATALVMAATLRTRIQ